MGSTTLASLTAALLFAGGCGSNGAEIGGTTNAGTTTPTSSGGAGGSGGATSTGGAAQGGGGSAQGGSAQGGAGGAPLSDCEIYCQKAETAGCGSASCVATCEKSKPGCAAETAAIVHCAVTTGAVTCQGPSPSQDGCTAAETALAYCIDSQCYAGNGACDPMHMSSCPAGKGCYWEVQQNYQFVCETPGKGKLGQPCSYSQHCVANLYCDDDQGGFCRKWCCQDSQCPGGKKCEFVAAGGSVSVKICR